MRLDAAARFSTLDRCPKPREFAVGEWRSSSWSTAFRRTFLGLPLDGALPAEAGTPAEVSPATPYGAALR